MEIVQFAGNERKIEQYICIDADGVYFYCNSNEL